MSVRVIIAKIAQRQRGIERYNHITASRLIRARYVALCLSQSPLRGAVECGKSDQREHNPIVPNSTACLALGSGSDFRPRKAAPTAAWRRGVRIDGDNVSILARGAACAACAVSSRIAAGGREHALL